jgi:hypothetical protein
MPEESVIGVGHVEEARTAARAARRRPRPPARIREETPKPDPVLPRSKFGHGGDLIHGARTRQLPSSHFGYSAVLTEIVLMGNVACRTGEKITYDLKNGKVLGNDKANALLRREPRKGWELGY